MNPEVVERILEKHTGDRDGLISILEDIQSRYGYLPQEALRLVADKTGRPLVDVYGVATFYRAFSLKPRGKHLVSVCQGTACHVRSSPAVAEALEKQLGIPAGETTPDREFTLEKVACLGACALGPIVVIDGHYFSQVKPAQIKGILAQAREGLDKVEITTDLRIFPLEVSCPKCNHSLMDAEHLVDCYPSIRVTASFQDHHCWLNLSALYGSYNLDSEYDIPVEAAVNFFCPHCHAELIGASDCTDCGAAMVPMIVRGGGMLQICSRRGCKNHMLDLVGSKY
ncbi:MAG: NADH-quinone oxidoreductase subunit NuoE [Candidatus Zixiibacteriota bacterium]|nr:MAG: NADH-quinone oxidoreductase subunit NuoE [candidate division Zixibacteria bacterium]